MGEDPPIRVLLRSFGATWLRLCRLRSEQHGGDPVTTFVFETLTTANAAHLSYGSAESLRLARPGPQADKCALLRPISGHAVAQSLGLPYETVRVRVQRMIAEGHVARVPGGLLAVSVLADSGPHAELAARTHDLLLASLRDLKALGLDFSTFAPTNPEPPPPPPALVNRIMLAMNCRCVELQAPPFGGLMPMIVWTGAAVANLRDVMADRELSWRYAGETTPAPDALRRPISVRALAAELDMPFETTRRYVTSLVESGWLTAIPGQGVVGTTPVVAAPGLGRINAQLPLLYARALTDLGRVGLDFAAI